MFGIKFTSDWLRGNSRGQPARYVPVLYGLEDRCLLSTFNEYPVPDNGYGVELSGITVGPDGNVWFTNAGGVESSGGEIESITPAGAITAFPQAGSSPCAIVTGADGNLWYGGLFGRDSFENAVIGRLTTDGTASRFFLPSFGGFNERVEVVTLGPDGNVWYGQSLYSPQEAAIGHITPDGQATSSLVAHDRFGASASGGIDSITAGPDGNIWFIPEYLNGHYYVERVTPDGQYTLFETPGQSNLAFGITGGPDGNVWATLNHQDNRGHIFSASIAQVTVDGQFTEFPLPDGNHVAASITTGPDGNLWFTEPFANQIGMMTPDGQLTEYAIPTPNSNPQLMTAGPDGNLWFTELGSNQIGEFILDNGGSAAKAAPAKSTPLAQAVRSAAIDALFAGIRPDPLMAVVVNQPPVRLAIDGISAASRPGVITASPAKQPAADALTLHHQHSGDRADATATALANLFGLDLEEVR